MLLVNSGKSFIVGKCSTVFGMTIKVRGEQTFSVKGQIINSLGYAGLLSLLQLFNPGFIV